MSHTPGPWKAVDAGKHWNNPTLTNIEIHYSEDGECIADTVYEMDDALLIAAAPELLVACREVAEWLDLLKQNYPDMAGLIRGCQKARAAIAKAEGREA